MDAGAQDRGKIFRAFQAHVSNELSLSVKLCLLEGDRL